MPGVEPDPPRCKRDALPGELHPRVDADGWSRTTTARGYGVTGRWARQRPASAGRSGGRPDSNRRRGDHDPECCRLHHGHSGDGRTRTGGLSPDQRALYATELRPHRSRADGIRTRGLELMRLARTTAPLPRKVWLAGLEPAIPGFQGRWGGQLPHSQMTNVVTSAVASIVQHLAGNNPRVFPTRPHRTGAGTRKERESNPQSPRTHHG
jgi:hypothetical protein